MIVENEELQPEQPEQSSPRPRWQVWLARIGLVVFIILLLMYYTNIFKGGA